MKTAPATFGFAAVVLGIVLILVIPLPPLILDALLAFNILGTGIVLLTAVTISDPLEFAAFAPVLLIATLFRLSLDVSATRLILTQGNQEGGVGAIIPAFGALVVHGNLVVGMIVFAILITIQFIVIASGSQRVAEVAARFTLDAMPGKQMAIDAEVHGGALDADGARRRRALVQKEADFYGALDGAGKFIKGDAIAALVIVALNLLGGVVVGVAYDGMDALAALNAFAMLSIGNALVTTLPAFLLSTSMGLMVTRATADASLGSDLAAQLLERGEILAAAGGFSLVLALVPALPQLLFVGLALGLFGLAWFSKRRKSVAEAGATSAREAAKRSAIRRPETALALLGVDALSIDVGADLAPLLVSPHCDALLDRVGEVRRALAAEIGIVLPGVRLRDDLSRDAGSYAIRVRDRIAGEGTLRLHAVLAVAEARILGTLHGEAVREPVYGMEARWIAPADRDAAIAAGALVFDPISIVGSHLAELAREHAATLLGRQELQTLLEHLRASVPTLVKEIGGDALPLATVHRVFEGLLRERVWPRDVVATLEALVDASGSTRDSCELIEAVRRVLVPAQLARANVVLLEPMIFAPETEADLTRSLISVGVLAPSARLAAELRNALTAYAGSVPRSRAAVVCTAALRPALAEFVRRLSVQAEVLGYSELPPTLELRPNRVFCSEADAPAALCAPLPS